jgi:hypothetical protein
VKLTGTVHGGQNPITGANVYLFAANTTGYGGPGLAASSSNASVSLLTSAVFTNNPLNSGEDGNGNYYVTTDVNGNFSITGDYTCTLGQQVYLYALGGNPGLGTGTNPAAGLLAALGSCPTGGNFLSGSSPISYVVVNEVSTVATAYAFAGFATDATHVSSSGTALAQTGIMNAFANAANLETLGTGVALATTPAGNGTVPQSEINTLANILAACVNSNGTGSACTTLFNDAQSGGSTGTQATDTATAAINMAHNPGANITPLYMLSTANPPFGSALSAQPNDFTVALSFTGGGLRSPVGIAIDGSDNAWVVSGYNDAVTVISTTGTFPSGANGYPGSRLNVPYEIVIDASGDAWITNYDNFTVTKLSSSGSPASGSPYSGGGLQYPYGIAIDGSGNAWVTNETKNTVTKLSNSGAVLSGASGYTGGGLDYPVGIAIDGAGSAWIVNQSSSSVVKISNSGGILSGTSGYAGGGKSIAIDSSGNAWIAGNPVVELSNSGTVLSGTNGYVYTGNSLNYATGIAIDGSGNAWITTDGGVYEGDAVVEFSNSGTLLSGTNGYTGGGQVLSGGIAIDGSGDVWTVSNSTTGTVAELIGVATPVITPICAGLPATPTANGTSNLGTRP